MSKQSRDAKLPCQNDLIAQCNDLMIQYNQLLCLRAELARLLLSRSKRPPARKDRTTRRNRLERAVKLNERPASCAPILLLISDRPQTQATRLGEAASVSRQFHRLDNQLVRHRSGDRSGLIALLRYSDIQSAEGDV